MSRTTTAALVLSLTGCALPAPPPAPVPPEILSTSAVARPDPALLDPFTGRYASAADVLVVSRSGNSLLVSQGPARATLTFVGSGTFADAAGNSYIFDNNSRRLTVIDTDGRRRTWARAIGE